MNPPISREKAELFANQQIDFFFPSIGVKSQNSFSLNEILTIVQKTMLTCVNGEWYFWTWQKCVSVQPVRKNVQKLFHTNYCPVWIISMSSELMETFINHSVLGYLENQKLQLFVPHLWYKPLELSSLHSIFPRYFITY